MYFVGASLGGIRTHLEFDGDRRYELTQLATMVFGGLATPSGWSFRAAVGSILEGGLEGDDTPGMHDMSPGLAAALGAARRWTFGDGQWFVTGSATLSAAVSSTRLGADDDVRFAAADLNLGAMAGRTFGTRWSPYLLARAFGGPVWWSIAGEDVTGTDTSHVQIGAGASVTLPYGVSVVVDVSALGEQSASVGVSWQP